MHYMEMSPELLEQVNAILDKEIDPLYFEVEKRIAPELGGSKYLPWLLAHKMSPDGCKVLLALPDAEWKPGMGEYEVSQSFITDLVEKEGLSESFIRQQLEESYYSGDIMFNDKTGPFITTPRGLWIDVQNSRRWTERNGTAYYRIIGIMLEQEFSPLMEKDADSRAARHAVGFGRIVPRYDSVKDFPGLLPAENYREILKSKEIMSQNQCACCVRYPEYNQDTGVCLAANDKARFMIKRELGREIGWEDAFEYVRKAGKKVPLCHAVGHGMELKDIGNVFCNCNSRSCGVLRHTKNTGGTHKYWNYYQKSRFRAVVDPEKCINCGLCANKRCMFDAIYKKFMPDAGKEAHYVDEYLCMGCGCCVETCPAGALSMKLVDPPEVLLGWELDENGKPMMPETTAAPAAAAEKPAEHKDRDFDPFNK